MGVACLLTVAGQLYGLYRPTGPPVIEGFPYADKLEHAAGFALPVALLLALLSLRGTPHLGTRYAVIGVFAAHAVISEIIQHVFYRNRTGDPYDVLADWIGIALGLTGSSVARYVWRRGREQNGNSGG